ncbi:ribose-5-phosphate isomerase A, partial [Francisella tularensis]|uniref:ribose-5-phosphate isomerase A n=1 Tax=Francisella tularensis TaxID=263 RepID=UPI002381A03C
GNVILDVYNLKIDNPLKIETVLNEFTGVVTNGIFALKPADTLIMATKDSNIVLL